MTAVLENSTESLSILLSPSRPRRIKHNDSSQTLTKEMIGKAFQKRIPRQATALQNDSKLMASFTSISVENGLGSPSKRPAMASPRRSRSSSGSMRRKDCFPKSKLLSNSFPELPLASTREKVKVSAQPEKDHSIGKLAIKAYDEHKKHFATCRPSRRKVKFSEKIDDGPKPSFVRVEDLCLKDLSLPLCLKDATLNYSSSVEELTEDVLTIQRLEHELHKACGKIGRLLEVIAADDEESKRLEKENKHLRRCLQRSERLTQLL